VYHAGRFTGGMPTQYEIWACGASNTGVEAAHHSYVRCIRRYPPCIRRASPMPPSAPQRTRDERSTEPGIAQPTPASANRKCDASHKPSRSLSPKGSAHTRAAIAICFLAHASEYDLFTIPIDVRVRPSCQYHILQRRKRSGRKLGRCGSAPASGAMQALATLSRNRGQATDGNVGREGSGRDAKGRK
jgi:hypothetical protein